MRPPCHPPAPAQPSAPPWVAAVVETRLTRWCGEARCGTAASVFLLGKRSHTVMQTPATDGAGGPSCSCAPQLRQATVRQGLTRGHAAVDGCHNSVPSCHWSGGHWSLPCLCEQCSAASCQAGACMGSCTRRERSVHARQIQLLVGAHGGACGQGAP